MFLVDDYIKYPLNISVCIQNLYDIFEKPTLMNEYHITENWSSINMKNVLISISPTM